MGEDFFLCFSPERVDPGNPVWQTKNTPKVIGGITPSLLPKAGMALYSRFFDTLVPVSSTEAAELTKILENTFRAVNIGLVNEVALIADRLGVDVWEVIDAAATKPFGFMKFTPGPGLGGHCIPVDPHYLSWKMRTLNYKTRFIDVASEINSAMPEFVVGKVWEALNRAGKAGQRCPGAGAGRRIQAEHRRRAGVPGPGYHPPPGGRWREGGSTTTPMCRSLREDGHVWIGEAFTHDLLSSVDVAVIVTDHANVDHAMVMDSAPIVVDSRNATKGLVSGVSRASRKGGS